MSDFPVLTTSRLHLKEITQSDVHELHAIHSDPVNMRWYGKDPVRDLDEARNLIDGFSSLRQLPAPGIRWGLHLKGHHRLIGSCGFFGRDARWRKCLLGYELARDAWGAGYMREAVAAALNWAFAHTDVHRIEAIVHPDNEASLALLRSLQFEQEGRLREGAFWGARRHDMLLLSLLKHEFAG